MVIRVKRWGDLELLDRDPKLYMLYGQKVDF